MEEIKEDEAKDSLSKYFPDRETFPKDVTLFKEDNIHK